MRPRRIIAALFLCLLSGLLPTPMVAAVTVPDNFSLQVTPSPLVTTVKPGVPTDIELKIHNGSTGTEELKIEPRSFTYSSTSGRVELNDTTPPDISNWISFSNPTFTAHSGEWFTQKIHIALPKESGFSYSLALVISRKNNPLPTSGGRLLKGSVAVFTLVNVDRPGATRKLEVPHFTSVKKTYEFLPATLTVTFKNSGNSIVQPYGNIFIQRTSNDKHPLSTLPVNEAHGYILPGSTRSLTTSWSSGFPAYSTAAQADGSYKTSLSWDFNHVTNFRIGRYTAKLVAVYNDGNRDVPIESEVSFWVIPWRPILLLILLIVVLWQFQRWRLKRKTDKAVKRALAAAGKKEQDG